MNATGSRWEQQPGFAEFAVQAPPGAETGMPSAGAAAVEGGVGDRQCGGGSCRTVSKPCWRHFWRGFCVQLENSLAVENSVVRVTYLLSSVHFCITADLLCLHILPTTPV